MKNLLVAVAVVGLSCGLNAATRVFTGAGGSWSSPDNWSDGAVPVAGDAIIISNATADAVIDIDYEGEASPAYGDLTVSSKTAKFAGKSLSVSSLYAGVPATFDVPVTLRGTDIRATAGSVRLYFNDDVSATQSGTVRVAGLTNSEIHFYKAFNGPGADLNSSAGGDYNWAVPKIYFHGPLKVKTFVAQNSYTKPYYYLYTAENEWERLSLSYNNGLYQMTDNALAANGVVTFSVHYVEGDTSSSYYLNGFDAVVNRVDFPYATAEKATVISNEKKRENACRIVAKTGTAQTFTTRATADADSVNKFVGPLHIVHDSEGGYAQTYSMRTNAFDAGSTITVKRGTLRIANGALWRNVSSIDVQGGAFEACNLAKDALFDVQTVTVADGASFSVSEAECLPFGRGLVSLSVTGTGAVELPEGVEWWVVSYEKDGVRQGVGRYPAGDGVIVVSSTGVVRTWTGAASDGKLSTPGNWSPVGVPAAGETLVVNGAGAVDGEIVCDTDVAISQLELTGSTPFRLTGFVNHGGPVMKISATAAVTNAADIAFPAGEVRIVCTGAGVFANEGAISGEEMTELCWESSGKKRFFFGGTSTYTCPTVLDLTPDETGNNGRNADACGSVNVETVGAFGAGSATVTMLKRPSLYFRFAGTFEHELRYAGSATAGGSIVFHPPVNQTLRFEGDWTFETSGQISLYSSQPNASSFYAGGVTLEFANQILLPKSTFYTQLSNGWTIKFLKHMEYATNGTDGGSHGSEGGEKRYYDTITCQKIQPTFAHSFSFYGDNLFAANPPFVDFTAYRSGGENWGHGMICLNGHDQVFDRLQSSPFVENSKQNWTYAPLGMIKNTGGAATVTLHGTASAVTQAKIGGSATDPVSIVWAATDAAFVQTFSNNLSKTCGDLTALTGTVRVACNSYFPNVKKLTIGEQGGISIASTNDLAFGSVEEISIAAGGTLTLLRPGSDLFKPGKIRLSLGKDADATGRLVLSAGDFAVKTLSVDGMREDAGYWGSPDCTDPRVPTAHKTAAIEGPGVLFVRCAGEVLFVR